MGKQPIQESTYVDEDLSQALEDAAEDSHMSKSQILKEGLRRQLQVMQE